jgi:hypothetical protein
MRYLAISLDQGSIIVEVNTCQKCFYWKSQWWKTKLWQHPTTGKVHQVDIYGGGRTRCGLRFPSGTKIVDRTVAVSVS